MEAVRPHTPTIPSDGYRGCEARAREIDIDRGSKAASEGRRERETERGGVARARRTQGEDRGGIESPRNQLSHEEGEIPSSGGGARLSFGRPKRGWL